MATAWFRLPGAGDGSESDKFRPDLKGYDVEGYSGNKTHPGGAPIWIVRVKASAETLDNISSEPGVMELSEIPVQALNAITGNDRTKDQWNQCFTVS